MSQNIEMSKALARLNLHHVCYNWVKGKCDEGDNCQYRHVPQLEGVGMNRYERLVQEREAAKCRGGSVGRNRGLRSKPVAERQKKVVDVEDTVEAAVVDEPTGNGEDLVGSVLKKQKIQKQNEDDEECETEENVSEDEINQSPKEREKKQNTKSNTKNGAKQTNVKKTVAELLAQDEDDTKAQESNYFEEQIESFWEEYDYTQMSPFELSVSETVYTSFKTPVKGWYMLFQIGAEKPTLFWATEMPTTHTFTRGGLAVKVSGLALSMLTQKDVNGYFWEKDGVNQIPFGYNISGADHVFNYDIKDALAQKLFEYTGMTVATRRREKHQHGDLAATRAVIEDHIYKMLSHDHPNKVIIDIGSNGYRHVAKHRHVQCLMPEILPRDVSRHEKTVKLKVTLKNTATLICKHKMQDCQCQEGVPAMAIHSLYYLPPDDIVDFMLSQKVPVLISLHHEFPELIGTHGEATYERTYVPGKGLFNVRMDVSGNSTPYVHSALDWMALGYHKHNGHTLVWDTTQFGFAGLVISKFTLEKGERGIDPVVEKEQARTVAGVLDDRSSLERFKDYVLGQKDDWEYIELDKMIHMRWNGTLGCVYKPLMEQLVVEYAAARQIDEKLHQTMVMTAKNLLRKTKVAGKINDSVSRYVLTATVNAAIDQIHALGVEHQSWWNIRKRHYARFNLTVGSLYDNMASDKKMLLGGVVLALLTWKLRKPLFGLLWGTFTMSVANANKIEKANTIWPCFLSVISAAGLTYVQQRSNDKPKQDNVSLLREKEYAIPAVCTEGVELLPLGKNNATKPKDIHVIKTMHTNRCVQNIGGYLLMGVKDRLPSIPSVCTHNVETALRNRLTNRDLYEDFNQWQLQPQHVQKLVEDRDIRYIPTEYEEWVARFPVKRRNQFQYEYDAMFNTARNQRGVKPFSRVGMFLKKEWYMKNGLVGGECKGTNIKPRLISAPDERWLVQTGPVFYSLTNMLKKIMNGKQKGDLKVVYAAGYNSIELGAKFCKLMKWVQYKPNRKFALILGDDLLFCRNEGGVVTTWDIDAVCFEGSIMQPHLEYTYCWFIWMLETNWNAKDERIMKKIWSNGIKRHSMNFRSKQGGYVSADLSPMRFSGSGDTSVGNSLITYRNVLSICDAPEEGFTNAFHINGFEAEVVKVKTGCESFCSGYFYPAVVNNRQTRVWSPKIGRLLTKTFATFLLNVDRVAWMRTVAVGVLNDFNHIPVARAFVKRALELTEGVEGLPLGPDVRMKVERKLEMSGEEMIWMHDTYGLFIQEILDCESYIETTTDLTCMSHPVLTRIIDVDCPIKETEAPAYNNMYGYDEIRKQLITAGMVSACAIGFGAFTMTLENMSPEQSKMWLYSVAVAAPFIEDGQKFILNWLLNKFGLPKCAGRMMGWYEFLFYTASYFSQVGLAGLSLYPTFAITRCFALYMHCKFDTQPAQAFLSHCLLNWGTIAIDVFSNTGRIGDMEMWTGLVVSGFTNTWDMWKTQGWMCASAFYNMIHTNKGALWDLIRNALW